MGMIWFVRGGLLFRRFTSGRSPSPSFRSLGIARGRRQASQLQAEALEPRRVLASAAPADPTSTVFNDSYVSLAEDAAGVRVTVALGGTSHGAGDIVSVYLNGSAASGGGILLAQSAALTGKESSVSLSLAAGAIGTAGNEGKSNTIYSEIIDLTGSSPTGISFRSPGASFNLDTVPPSITVFAQGAGGSLLNKAGSVISLEATASETVNGSISVTLDTGAVVKLSAAAGGSTKLTGSYTVATKQNSADLAVVSFTTGGLRDLAGNPVDAANSAIGSIGMTNPIVVDTADPTVATVSLPPAGTYFVTASPQMLTLTVKFSEPVTLPTTAFVRGFIGPNGNANAFATSADFVFLQSLNNGSTYEFVYLLTAAVAPTPALPPDIDGITFDATIWDAATPGTGAVIADPSGNVLSPTTNALATALTPNPTAITIGPSTTVAKVVFDAIAPTPRVDPVQFITVTFKDSADAGAAVPFGPGLGSLALTEDFQLRRNGVLIDLTTPDTNGKVPEFTYVTNPVDPFYAARFQLRNLAHLTALPGAYRLTFSDIGIGPSAELAWTVTYATPGELTAAVDPQPIPAAGTTFLRTTPVDSVKVVFMTSSPAGVSTPVAVKNVDTTASGSDIKQFLLYKGEALVPLPATARVTGSGSTYYLTGLAPVTQDTGSYDLIVVSDEVTNSLGAAVRIMTLSDTPMIAATGTSWQYVNTTITSALVDAPTGGTGIVRQHGSIDLVLTFSAAVVVDPNLPAPSIDVYLSTYGNGSAKATYLGGSGTKVLTFRYMIQNGDISPAGVAFASSIGLNGGSVLDVAGRQPLLSFKQPSAANVIVDTVAPLATAFVLPAAGLYSPGARMLFGVAFDEAMQVTGSPRLTFTYGGQTRTALFDSVDASTVYFRYDVLPADAGSSAVTATAVALNGGRITDLAGNPAILTGLVSATTNLPIDTRAPVVTNVASTTANGSYKAGDRITLIVSFQEAVTVTGGTPTLLLNAGSSAVASWTGEGSGTNALTFEYAVEPGDATTAKLDYADPSALTLGGAIIRDAAGNDAVLSLPAVGMTGSLSAVKNIRVDTLPPTVAIVASPISLTGMQKATVKFTTSSDTAAAVLHGKSLPSDSVQGGTLSALRVTATTGGREYVATFTPDMNSPHVGAIAVPAGWFADKAGNGNDLSVMADAIVHVPTVQSITTSTAAGRYAEGAPVFVTVVFDEAVTINGSAPRLALNVGPSRFASYVSGDGTSTLTFRYIVQAGDAANAFDYVSAAALIGDLRNAADIPAATTLPVPGDLGSIAHQATIVIDTISPVVAAIRPRNTPDGAYAVGRKIRLQVEFSEPVIVASGIPTLRLNAGSNAVANWNGVGSGTSTLVFVYTVQQGDAALIVGPTAGGLLGVIRDMTGNVATLTVPPGGLAGNAAIAVDTLAPSVAAVESATPSGSYQAGSGIWLRVRFTENVVVSGVPQLLLNSAGSRAATYYSGSGTNLLTFLYVVQPGDAAAALDYGSRGALLENGGSIKDLAGNAASLLLPAPGAAGSIAAATNLQIDTGSPWIASLRALTANGTYGIGQTVRIAVVMSEPVTVSGAGPILLLNTKRSREATFEGPFGTPTDTLTFVYLIQPGDISNRLDAMSFLANNALIIDRAGNVAATAVPAVGLATSLAGSSAIAIDAVVRATAGGLSTTQETAPSYNVPLTRLALTFNTPISGLSLAAIKLFYEGRSVTLTGATLTASGSTYTLTLPQASTSLRGLYRVRIGGIQSGVTAAGVAMEPATNLFWRRV